MIQPNADPPIIHEISPIFISIIDWGSTLGTLTHLMSFLQSFELYVKQKVEFEEKTKEFGHRYHR